jgi:hypothetical protein
MAEIINVEPIAGPPGERWIAIAYDDGRCERRRLKPFDVVPRVANVAPLGDAGAGARRVQFTVVQGGKRA